jgi:hypothetical protein
VPSFYANALGVNPTLLTVLSDNAFNQPAAGPFNLPPRLAAAAFLTNQLKPYGYMWDGQTTVDRNPIGNGGVIAL